MAEKFDRLYVALVTPYKAGTYDIDEAQLRNLLEYFMQPKFVDAGGAVIINAEAGEIFYLLREEKRRNVEIAVEVCGGKVPVVAGAIAPTTKESVEVAVDAKAAGADGIFLIPPVGALDVTGSWNAERYPEVWIDMAKDICAAVDLPAITHPVTSPTLTYGVGLPLPAVLKMCTEVPQIVGWKMTYSYGGYRIVAKALRQYPRHVAVLSSSAQYFHEFMCNEMLDGTVTGALNYGMEPMVDHTLAWRRGDLKEARRIWNHGLMDLHEFVYSDYSRLHIRYKIACWLRGLIESPFMRPPMPKPKAEEALKLRELLQGAGLSVINESVITELL